MSLQIYTHIIYGALLSEEQLGDKWRDELLPYIEGQPGREYFPVILLGPGEASHNKWVAGIAIDSVGPYMDAIVRSLDNGMLNASLAHGEALSGFLREIIGIDYDENNLRYWLYQAVM